MLEVKHLTKKYGKQFAVNHMDFQFENGIYGLLGPNGAGKTTLLGMIMGAIRPDNGDILFEGKSLSKEREIFCSKVGYLPQSPIFYKDFSGYEFLEYICVLKDIQKSERKNQIEHVLNEVNLTDASKKRIGAYSGGTRQRLGIAQALLGDPEVLIFDEPTAGLDPTERIRFRNTISRLSGEKTIIIATHIVPDVESIAQTIIMIKQGEILVQDTPEALNERIQGKVWALEVPLADIDQYIGQYKISNIQLINRHYILRIVSDLAPSEHAKATSPRLEESYIYFTEGDQNDLA